MLGHQPLQHPRARRARRSGIAVGAARFRRLRQGHQQRGLGRGQPPWFLAEVGQRRRPHPLQIAAKGRDLQIQRQNLRLRQPPLQRQGEPDLAEFARHMPGAAILQQPRDLHRQGRSARNDMALRDRLHRRAQQRPGIDAVMLIEPPVLIGDQHLQIGRVHLRRVHPRPPDAIFHREGTQQAAIARQHLDRNPKIERRNHRRIDPGVEPLAPQPRQPQRQRGAKEPARPHGVTVTVPVSPWARMSGRYMSSTLAAGWWNVPGEIARTT